MGAQTRRRDELRAALRAARKKLLAAAGSLSDDDLRHRPSDDGWSAIEILAHLIDVDRHWLREAQAIAADPTHVFTHFDDKRWKREHADVRERSASAVLTELAASHAKVLHAIATMTDEDLARTGVHPRGHAYAVSDVFERYVDHDEAHARQLHEIREALAGERS